MTAGLRAPVVARARSRPLVRRASLDLAVPALIRVVECLLQLGFVALLDRGTGNGLAGRFTIWDGQLYADIASHGYPSRITVSDGRLIAGNNFAFSPGYPWLTRVVANATTLTTIHAEVVVSWIAGCALSVAVYLLLRGQGHSRRTGYVGCALLGLLPMAVVFQMGYAEALFAAFSAAAMLAATRGRWWLAAVFAGLAAATRPIGYVVAAGLAVLAWQQRSSRRASRRAVITACLLGPVVTVAYWAGVGVVTGRATGWFEVERIGWGTHFDAGRSAARFVWSTITRPDDAPGAAACVVVILLGAVAVVAYVAMDRTDRAYAAVAAATFLSVIASTNFWHSRPRLLLAAAVVVVPLARRCDGVRLRHLVPWLVFGALLSMWFGAYMITRWPYAI